MYIRIHFLLHVYKAEKPSAGLSIRLQLFGQVDLCHSCKKSIPNGLLMHVCMKINNICVYIFVWYSYACIYNYVCVTVWYILFFPVCGMLSRFV